MRRGVVLFVLLMFSLSVFAQDFNEPLGFDSAESYNWLRENAKEAFTVEELSMSILALRTDVNDLVVKLNGLKDEAGCWPKGSCNAKDTALATYALSSLGSDVSASVAWLEANKVAWRGSGEWRVQIEAPDIGSGQCALSYKVGGQESNPITFTISGNEIGKGGSVQQGKYYVDVKSDLSSGIFSKPSSVIHVDCGGLTTRTIISLIYKEGNNIYILSDTVSAVTDLVISNACYGRGSCSYDDSLYVAWVLDELGVSIGDSNVYLEVEAGNNVLHKAMLSRFLQKRAYLDGLVDGQDTTGSWGGGSVYNTAFSVYALSKASEYSDARLNGEEYLKRVVNNDGSWNRNVRDTAMVLIALEGYVRTSYVPGIDTGDLDVSGSAELICDDGYDDDGDGSVDCGDDDCESFPACVGVGVVDESSFEDCFNGIDDDGDLLADCDDPDCYLECAGSSTSTDTGFDTSYEPEDLEEKSYFWIVWVVLIFVLIGGGVFFYFYYVKTGKIDFFKPKKPKGPTFDEFKRRMSVRPTVPSKPVQRPPVQRVASGRPVRSQGEDELEKSLREAEKLLKGGK